MNKLIKHKWKEENGFKKHSCIYCGAIKIWDQDFNRIVYYTGSGPYFMAPVCKRTFLSDTVIK